MSNISFIYAQWKPNIWSLWLEYSDEMIFFISWDFDDCFDDKLGMDTECSRMFQNKNDNWAWFGLTFYQKNILYLNLDYMEYINDEK